MPGLITVTSAQWIIGYAVVMLFALRAPRLHERARGLAVLLANLATVAHFYFGWYGDREFRSIPFFGTLALASVCLAAIRFASTRGRASPRLHDLAVFLPWIALFSIKALGGPAWLGISYLFFRISLLAVEVRSGLPVPSWSRAISFAFFLPTYSMGPISPFRRFGESWDHWDRIALPPYRALERVALGCVKLFFLSPWAFQLTFSAFWVDGNRHGVVDFWISCFAYYAHIYFNFSGFCDIAIGGAALLGLSVKENFNHPWAARNVQDFWSRWHISLSEYMRDVVFTPLSKVLLRRWGMKSLLPVTVFASAATFLILGVWHGLEWNYALFGAYHALGVSLYHVYAHFLRTRLTKPNLKRYLDDRLVTFAARVVTAFYIAYGFFLFENSFGAMKNILEQLKNAHS